MANYKETNIAGTSYIRAHTGHIFNTLNGDKTIQFHEERVINLSDSETIKVPCGSVTISLVDENAGSAFPVINPETGEPVSLSSYQNLYVLLHSFYIHLAALRDNQEPL